MIIGSGGTYTPTLVNKVHSHNFCINQAIISANSVIVSVPLHLGLRHTKPKHDFEYDTQGLSELEAQDKWS